jgi:hypothetical protein
MMLPLLAEPPAPNVFLGGGTHSVICARSAIMGFLSLAVSTNALPLRTEREGESYW